MMSIASGKKVRKAIIPAAGLGTRFLPATKAVAKEMLPIVDRPTIQFIVDEAVKSGITDILIITGSSKRSIEDYFDSNPRLEIALKKSGKNGLLELVNESTRIKVHFTNQPEQKGLGDAVLQAKAFVGDEPFVVMLGDDIMESETPLTQQLINDYNEVKAPVLAVKKMPREEINKYGVIDFGGRGENGLYDVKKFVEKPKVDEAPSDLAIIGRYLLTPEIFDLLESQEIGAGGEVQLTDAIDRLNKTQRVFAREFTGVRHDVGDKFGFVKFTLDYALAHPQVKDDIKTYILKLAEELK